MFPSPRFQTALTCLAFAASAFVPSCGGDAGEDDESSTKEPLVEEPTDQTRVRRLTHQEWRNSVIDILNVSPGEPVYELVVSQATRLRRDSTTGAILFAGEADELKVDAGLAFGYSQAAAQVAETVVNDNDVYGYLVNGNSESNKKNFINDFGVFTHRRLLTDEQKATYDDLFESGRTKYEDTRGFKGGVRLVIEAMLQSPYFLYRLELSDEDEREKGVPLDGPERAARLSYFMWGTMPDAELLIAAFKGDLDSIEGMREQAERLADDDRMKSGLLEFLGTVLAIDSYRGISPKLDSLGSPENLGDLAYTEARLFLEQEIYAKDGGITTLFTSTNAYLNPALGALYDVDASEFDGDGFIKISLSEDRRKGFFTRVGFLAKNSTRAFPDPIHRGVFLSKRIACLPLGNVPDGVPALPEVDPDVSNRERVEQHTESENPCRGCHQPTINPYGFAFENYTSVGSYTTKDGKHTVDASTEVLMGNNIVPVEDAVDLMAKMASHASVHECFAKHLISYAHGRALQAGDAALAEGLGELSLQEGLSVKELMVELALADSFLYRPASTKSEN